MDGGVEGVRMGQEKKAEHRQRAREIGRHIEYYPTTIQSMSTQS